MHRGMLDCDSRYLRHVDVFAWDPVTVGFNSGETHQIFDDPQHSPGFGLDRRAEPGTHLVAYRPLFAKVSA
jgi:hypothetical protein